MNSRRTILLLSILTVLPLLGMELDFLSIDQDTPLADYEAVPTLKKLVLKRLIEHLVREDDRILLTKIKNLYPDAASQCAQALGEEELRVLQWKLVETNRRSAQLDHRRLNERNLPRDKSWNNVQAASFSPDNNYLLTVTSRGNVVNGDCECNWVAYVWSMSEIEKSMIAQRPCQPSKKSQLKPLSELVFPREKDCGRLYLQLAWHPSSTMAALSINRGDGYILQINQGILTHQRSFKVVHEEQRISIESLAFDSTGIRLLIRAWRHYLFCIDLEDEDHFMPEHTILDTSQCIIDDAFCADWYPDGRILYIDCNDKMLTTIDHSGSVLEKKALRLDPAADFESCDSWLTPQRIIFTPNAQKIIIHSTLEITENGVRGGLGGRVDICSLKDGSCVRPFKQQHVHLQFLDERYVIQVEERPDLGVYFCDIKALKSATIVRWQPSRERLVALSPRGKYVYLSLDDSRMEFPPFEPSVIMTQTPFIDAFTLEQLIVLAKMNYYGTKEVLKDPEYAGLYRELESSSPYKNVIREYFKE